MDDDSKRAVKLVEKGGPRLKGYMFVRATGYWLTEGGFSYKPDIMNLPYNSDGSGKSVIDPNWPRKMYYLADMKLSTNQKFIKPKK